MIDSIVCVLKTGGDFDVDDVKALYNGCRRNSYGDWEFIVLTDDLGLDIPHDQRVTLIQLKHDLPRHWSKVEMWRPDLAERLGRAFYTDLDMVIVGDIDPILNWRARADEVLVTKDWYHGGPSQSMLLYEPGDCRMIWNKFWDGDANYADHVAWIKAGDEGQVKAAFYDQILFRVGAVPPHLYIQDQFPDLAASFKATKTKPDDLRILGFHGQPRPREAAKTNDFVREHWRP